MKKTKTVLNNTIFIVLYNLYGNGERIQIKIQIVIRHGVVMMDAIWFIIIFT